MSFIIVLLSFILVFKVISSSKKSSSKNKTSNRNNYNRSNYSGYNGNSLNSSNTMRKAQVRQPLGNIKTDERLLNNYEFKRSQEARKAYLKEKYGDKLKDGGSDVSYVQQEAKFDVNQQSQFETKSLGDDIYDNLHSEFSLEPCSLPDLSCNTDFGSGIGTILDSAFDYKSDVGFGTKFEHELNSSFSSKSNVWSEPKTDGMRQNEETVTDAFLREYGLEKKVYEWEE